MQKRIQSFPPKIYQDSKVLILGSIPGVKSLERQEYYAHPQNQFWKLMFHILGEEFSENYNEKLDLLKRNKIALWDTIESCEREGSLDAKIKNEIANSIVHLLQNYPNINVIFCNGQKSYKNLLKQIDSPRVPVLLMPSTSPLHTVSFEEKRQQWAKILEYLG
ncbi:MAG: DNA-deoxyinosine glycosylase [Flavobacteriaceae bacterium]|nr:DNA-deoxyinosine glycosylase [Flavobacteriaceae bacterium]